MRQVHLLAARTRIHKLSAESLLPMLAIPYNFILYNLGFSMDIPSGGKYASIEAG